jgi:type VI secretion system protein ImpF
MADAKNQRPELPSVLDRLIDEDPRQTGERTLTVKELATALRNAVRRDIEDLLNTRQRPDALPEGLADLAASSYEYGIPDFSGANLGSRERRRRYLKSIEDLLKQHEPRFASVKVVPADDRKTTAERTMHFKIDAVLRTEPLPEAVLYDSQLDIPSRLFKIEG